MRIHRYPLEGPGKAPAPSPGASGIGGISQNASLDAIQSRFENASSVATRVAVPCVSRRVGMVPAVVALQQQCNAVVGHPLEYWGHPSNSRQNPAVLKNTRL